MLHLAIFASGGGSNAESIMHYFDGHSSIRVALVVCNKEGAGVLEKAQAFRVDAHVLAKRQILNPEETLPLLRKHKVDLIVLAGFLLLVPAYLLQEFPQRIMNIHPALLPQFGGKGMYGMHVHRKVKEAGEKVSGMSIHLIDEEYDRGKILFQAETLIDDADSAKDIAAKVLQLEHKYYPRVIEDYCFFEMGAKIWNQALPKQGP